MAAQLDTLDIIVLVTLLIGTIAYFTRGTYWAIPNDPYKASLAQSNGVKSNAQSRDFIQRLEEAGKNCLIFYGSQTGTAEDFANRLAKEASSRFGLKTIVADLEDYDFDNLDAMPQDKVAFFVLATYGEGEPTDNAVDFYEFISGEEPTFSQGESAEEKPLTNLRYVAFGLGNNTYEHYNSVVRNVNKALENLGAIRIGKVGEGDDGAGTMEEDFLAWKEPMWAALTETMGLEEREAVYEPTFAVVEQPDMSPEDDIVYLGEPNKHHLRAISNGPYSAANPYCASIVESQELFHTKERNCLHMEIDISGTNLSYTTGDHIAIWPTNPGIEVDRFLSVMGLSDRRHTVVTIKGLDPTARVPFPSPTTYDAILRYYMEICAPISRQFVSQLVAFAPNEELKASFATLGADKDIFHAKVTDMNYNIARLMESKSKGAAWKNIPFSFLIEGLNKLQPRYYSISSSSHVNHNRVAITAVVDSVHRPDAPHVLKGVTTNYLLSLKLKQAGEVNTDPWDLRYELNGPRNKYDGIHVPVHIRHSNFKLPSDPSKPIIMIGPGTGVAPFRGFVQERAALAREGVTVGRTILFFGCRRKSEDFLYKHEWEEYAKDLGDKFSLITAFSRDTPEKVYVQHRIKENAAEINELLMQRAYLYVCGDAANMAREVHALLVSIIAEQRGLGEQKAEEEVKRMRAINLYQEDVWS